MSCSDCYGNGRWCILPGERRLKADERRSKVTETWKDRAREFYERKPGQRIRLRIPDDVVALLEDWIKLGGDFR